MKKSTGINFDYILALKLDKKNKRLEKVKIPIKRSESLIKKVINLYENNNKTIIDIFKCIKENIPKNMSFDDCLYCLEYRDESYNSRISFPQTEYEQEKEELLKDKKKNALVGRYKEGDIEEILKEKYTIRSLAYIYSFDYYNTLSTRKSELKVYSHEYRGFKEKVYLINDDINLKIKTNFCYGNASHFNLTVTYKGIELLPYSFWVTYYYVKYEELLKCTRPYDPMRSNWEECLDFIIDFANKAIDNPKCFVEKTVMEEVDTMIKGLSNIFEEPKIRKAMT